jgi:uncharacterized protein (DUF433 family)
MRYPVEMILDLLSAGITLQDIIKDYPALEENDIIACLVFASKLTDVTVLRKVT